MADALERDDVQGLLLRGYGRLRAARYLLGEIVDGAPAAAWLGRLTVATGGPHDADTALNVAFTASGLRRLGLGDQTLAGFSAEFTEGMTAEHRRRALGDVEESAPARWTWGAPGGDRIDVLLALFAGDEAALARLVAEHEEAWRAGGIRRVAALETAALGEREHFGFKDGIAQPRFAGIGDWPARDVVATGELLLGYPNAYGRFTPRPRVDDGSGVLPADAEGTGRRDLGRNGSYLVLRQLRQDVEGFWDFCAQATSRPDGSPDADARQRLAAKMIGRWPSGTPLVLAPDADVPVADQNDFAYFAADHDGLRCPIGAHVRRANPRDTLDPAPGTDRSVAVNKRHRLLRRGRKYGAAGDAERGLHFIGLAANISRQFEFVQHSWLNDPAFNTLYDHPDPLLSPAGPGGRTFTVPRNPVRERYTGLPRFVSVRGGAYFFLPGLRALRYLAALPRP